MYRHKYRAKLVTTNRQYFHADMALLPVGWGEQVRIAVQAGIITDIATGVPRQQGDEVLAMLLPGLPNLHSHAFQRGMAGLGEVPGPSHDSFWSWREAMYRFVGRIGREELTAIAALAYVEMLESGFTRVGEFHYLHHDCDGAAFADPAEMSAAILAAAADTGIALTHLPVFYAHGGFGGAPPACAQRRFVTDLDQFATLLDAARAKASALPDAIVGIAPHSLRAVTPEELVALLPLADGAPIHIHIAEQLREVEDCLAWSGARPVQWLLDHAPVDDRWCLVHATHMVPAEIAAVARRGAVAGLCPITEANLGDGIFPARDFVAAGGMFGVGSDSNVLIDAAEELRLLEYGQRLALRERNVVRHPDARSTGEALYRHALAGGRRALGDPSPGIAVGHPADLLSLDIQHTAVIARSGSAMVDALLFASGRSVIDGVWRRGEKLVDKGRHLARNRIEVAYRSTMKRMLG
jgi:formiminoglutamate deiminase